MTTPTTPTAADAVTYLAALAHNTIEWTTESICENISEADVERLEDELHQLHQLAETASTLCTDFGSHDHYSDGRPIRTRVQLADGAFYHHLWHPVPAKDSQRSIEFPTSIGVRERVHILPPSSLAIENIVALEVVDGTDG